MLHASAAAGGNSLLLYSFSLGMLGAVNPCGFPLLPAYLALSGRGEPGAPLRARALGALGGGAAMSAGVVAVFALLGTLISLGVHLALGWLPWAMIPLGLALVAMGCAAAGGRSVWRWMPGRRPFSGRRRAVAFAGMGVAYAVASLGCALPLFVAGIVGSFSARGVRAGVAGSIAYSLGMGLVITAVSVAGASARPAALARVRALQPVAVRLAGGVVALVGAYLVLYWAVALATPARVPGPVRAVEAVQGDLARWISLSPAVTGASLAGVVVAVLAAALLGANRSGRPARRPRAPAEAPETVS